jgi:DNA primase
MMFTAESLETLRQRVDLVDLLSSHMELKRLGAVYKALCPFHEEKTASFMVRPGDRHYHCYGCGAHGDAITFLMERSHLSFSEAVESLAERFGVSLQRATEKQERADLRRRQLREVLRTAARFYHFALLHLEEASEALHYLFERGIDLGFINRFRLGFASASRGFCALMEQSGYSTELLKECGLVGNRGSDFFFDRILFPILDAMGNVVGFSGRRYKESGGGGKYVNTPETALFRKGEILFGLHESRRKIAQLRRVIVVEGQVDCLRLIHMGFDYTVAALGTAFGPAHLELLQQLGIRDGLIAFDGDGPGREAAVKVGDLLLRNGIGARIALLPPGADPDSLLLDEGPDRMSQLLDEARDYVSFLVDHLGGKMDATSPSGKGELAREVARHIREWPDPVVVHESLRRLARLLDLPEEMVGVGQRSLPQLQISRLGRLGKGQEAREEALEADVCRWLILMGETTPEILELSRQHLRPELFQSESYRLIFAHYLQLASAGAERDLMAIAARLEGTEAQEALDSLLKRRINRERVRELYCEAVQRLLDRDWMHRREAIRQQIQSGLLDDDAVMRLIVEFDALKGARPKVVWPAT